MLVLCMVLSLLPNSAFADEGVLTPNQDLLEAMLSGERQWVIETLVNDKRANNPMAIARHAETEPSMAWDALNHYRGGSSAEWSAYKTMIDAMYFAYNTDEYTKGFFDELGEIASWAVGLFTGDEIRSTAETLNRSRKEIHYDNLLQDIFTANYTASDGTTLLDIESSDVLIKQLQGAITYCSALSNYINRYISTVTDKEDYAAITSEYVNQYALPYGDAAEKALNALGELSNGGMSHNDKLAAQAAGNLAVFARLATISPKPSYEGFSYLDYLGEYFTDTGIADLVKATGKPFEAANTAFENYIFLESIRAQRDTIAAPLARLSAHATNDDMRQSINNFERIISEQYNQNFSKWDQIQTYLRNNQVVSNGLSKVLEGSLKKSLHLTEDYMLGQAVAELTNIVGIVAWISDQVIGLKTICAKTFELLYWEDIMKAGVETYYADLAVYQNDPTEKTARNVLDDLLMLQRLRLYGEKTAYQLASAPNNSWLGWVLDGEETLDNLYQRSVDILMSASPVPVLTGFTVGQGQTMRIAYDDKAGFIGNCSGRFYVDLPLRLTGGAAINGTLIINAGGRCFGAGYFDLGSTGTLLLNDCNLSAGEYVQRGGTLSLNHSSQLTCTERLHLGSPSIQSDAGPVTLTTRDLELSGTADCIVEASGDISGSGSITALTMNSSGQTVNGTISTKILRFSGASTSVDGNITVTDTLYGPTVKLTGGKNILLSGGTVEGALWNGSLSVQNAALSAVRINGALYDKGGTAYTGNVTVCDALNCTGTSHIGDSSTLSVYGSAYLAKALDGSGQIKFFGDLDAADDITFTPELNFSGSVPQDVSGNFTAGTVRFSNTGPGVKVWDTITVSELLDNPAGRIEAVKPVKLADGARLSGNFNGSISMLNGTLPDGAVIGGNLTLRDGGTISGTSAAVSGKLLLEETGTVDGCTMTVGGLTSSKSLTLQNNAQVTVRGSATLGGKLENPTELAVYDDLTMNGLTASGTLRARGDVLVSGTTTLGGLTLDGFFLQEVGGSSFTVGDLNVHNTSGRPLKLGQTITVTGRYDNPNTEIKGGLIQGGTGVSQEINTDRVLRGGLTQNVPLVLNNCTLTVEGPVSVPGVTLTSAHLIVKGKLTLTGSASSIDSGSTLTVRGEMRSASGEIILGGTLDVRDDLTLEKTKVTGGNLALGGDLYGSAAVQTESLILNGLIRQRIEADNLHTGDVLFANTSKGGVLLEKKLYYSGAFTPGATPLFNENNLVREAS